MITITREALAASRITVDVWPVSGCDDARYTIRRDGTVVREVVIPFAEIVEYTLTQVRPPDMDPQLLSEWAIRRATLELSRRLQVALREVMEGAQ